MFLLLVGSPLVLNFPKPLLLSCNAAWLLQLRPGLLGMPHIAEAAGFKCIYTGNSAECKQGFSSSSVVPLISEFKLLISCMASSEHPYIGL